MESRVKDDSYDQTVSTDGPGLDRVRPRLLIITDDGVERRTLEPGTSLTVGRSGDVDVRIDDPAISRCHLRLELSDGVRVTDLASANGTRVGDRSLRAHVPTTVSPGESIELGAAVLILQGSTGPEPSARGAPSSAEEGPMAAVSKLALRVARSSVNVILTGETGVGKDVLARRMFEASPRAGQPFVALNCASLSETLLESELFGHERGAFTGASQTKAGLLEACDGGVLFLDEVAELPLPTQAKLLRVLEDGRVRRVGSLSSRSVDVRFFSATNRDLLAEVQANRFREDLYFRLEGIAIHIPPLRERRDEIRPLTLRFVEEAARAEGLEGIPCVTPEAWDHLHAFSWPGNIRQLRSVIRRSLVLGDGTRITAEDLSIAGRGAPEHAAASRSRHGPTEVRILDALERCAGNQTRAARMLGISRRTLINRLDELGVRRPRKRVEEPW